jgi:WD40 repeat protein
VASLAGQGGWVSDAVFTHEGTGLYSVSTLGTTLGWDVSPKGPPPAKRLLDHDSAIDLTISPDGTSIAVHTDDGFLEIIDTTTGETRTERWPGGLFQNGGAPISPDWLHIAWLEATGESAVRNLDTMEIEAALADGIDPKAFTPDGRLLAFSGSPDAGTRAGVIDWEGGDVLLDLGVSYLVIADFNPDGVFEPGRYLAYIESDRVGRNNLLALYDMATGQRFASWEETDPIDLAFDPSGRYLAVGDVGGRAWVIDLAALVEGRSVAEATVFDVQAFDDIAWRVAMSPDGVLAVARQGAVRLWDVFGGRPTGAPMVNNSLPTLAFHPDGRSLMYTDQGVRTYWLDPEPLIPLARDRVTRELTEQECVRYLGDPCPAE